MNKRWLILPRTILKRQLRPIQSRVYLMGIVWFGHSTTFWETIHPWKESQLMTSVLLDSASGWLLTQMKPNFILRKIRIPLRFQRIHWQMTRRRTSWRTMELMRPQLMGWRVQMNLILQWMPRLTTMNWRRRVQMVSSSWRLLTRIWTLMAMFLSSMARMLTSHQLKMRRKSMVLRMKRERQLRICAIHATMTQRHSP